MNETVQQDSPDRPQKLGVFRALIQSENELKVTHQDGVTG